MKIDESELPGDPRRFRITKEDIERVGFSDACVGCNAMRQGKPRSDTVSPADDGYRTTSGARTKV